MSLSVRERSTSLGLLFGVLLAASGPHARADHGGVAAFPADPPVTRFEPDVEAYPQNFAVAQDDRGLVYLGNHDGLLVFDGERWTKLRLPNGDLVRSLAWDGAGRRMYVGGYDSFGWVADDAAGTLTYHELADRVQGLAADERFADIWETVVLPQGVFFRGLRHVFRYQPAEDRLTLWRHADRFGSLTAHGDEVVLQFRKEGLRRLVGERWERIPGTATFQDLVERWVPLGDGRLLSIAKDGRWLAWGARGVSTVDMPPGVGDATRYTRGLRLDDGSLALIDAHGMLHIVDLAHRTLHPIRISTGHLSGLVRARDGGLLISADRGLFHVEWPAPWARLERSDLAGSLHEVSTWGERSFVHTGAGTYELVRDATGAARFERRPWSSHGTFGLVGVGADTALLADNYALRLVDRRGARDLTHGTFYPRELLRSRFDPDTVLVGTELGLGVVRRVGGAWRLVFNLDDIGAPAVISVVELARGELLLGTERDGVRRLRFSADWRTLEHNELLEAPSGLAYGPGRWAWVAGLGEGEVYASTEAGLFRWQDGRFVPDPLGGLAALRRDGQTLFLARAPDGVRWAWDYARVFRQPADGTWVREDVESVRVGALERIAFGADGETLFIASGSILRHDPAQRPAEPPPAGLLLRVVEYIAPDGRVEPLPLDPDRPPRLELATHRLHFRYALTELRREDGARYRTRVEGYRDDWSDWDRGTSLSYAKMEPGDYALEVQGRDSLGRETGVLRYDFSVAPPWYAGTPALVVWALLVLALVAVATRAVIRRRTELLAADKTNLERMVGERTRELEAANRMLETMAHLDGLTGIPNRRRLDDYLDQVWVQCGARERPLAVLAIDVDRFKEFNDQHGHLAGDALLKRLAGLLTRSLRRTEDLAARYGGEEFLVVLPGAELEVAQAVAESLRERVASSSLGASISIGVASRVPRVGDSVADLVRAADAALYKAKQSGRDRVVLAGPPA